MSTQLENNTATMQSLLNAINNLPNASSLELDTTLTQAGMAADAKAVGDAIGVEVIELWDIQPNIFVGNDNAGVSSYVDLSDETAAKFRSFKNGQTIIFTMTYDGYIKSIIGTAKVFNGEVSFYAFCADVIYTMYMEADSNRMWLRNARYASNYHSHTADEIYGGMLSGATAACQYEDENGVYGQDPSIPMLRNTAIMPEPTDPEYDGEIYWTYE